MHCICTCFSAVGANARGDTLEFPREKRSPHHSQNKSGLTQRGKQVSVYQHHKEAFQALGFAGVSEGVRLPKAAPCTCWPAACPLRFCTLIGQVSRPGGILPPLQDFEHNIGFSSGESRVGICARGGTSLIS
ncbi:hypothetical protein H1C71_027465 [Ictidomys tridecemlineatus]|nr:hypothetical protein H1C71_027465 [Ictidomys tridecemlineatus]